MDKIENNINIFIGIDPSLNSTGMTIMCDLNTDNYIYNRMYAIKSKLTKKEKQILLDYNNKYINDKNNIMNGFYFDAVTYEHEDANIYNKEKNKDSHMFELVKTQNLINIVATLKDIILDNINNIIETYNNNENLNLYNIICHVCIETNSFNSRQRSVSLIELCGLNFLIRNMLLSLYKQPHKDNINIKTELICATPTEIKKFATYRGDADKELMGLCFKLLQPNIIKQLEGFKLDDIVDSYFMCLYAININEIRNTDNEYNIYNDNRIKSQLNNIIEDKKLKKKQERANKKSIKNKEQIWDNEMMTFADEI